MNEKKRKNRNRLKTNFFFSFCAILIISVLFLNGPIEVSIFDFIITKLFYLFGIFSFLLPICFLLTKKKKFSTIIQSLFIFILLLCCSFGIVFLHTEEYKVRFQEYLSIKKTKNISPNQFELMDSLNQSENKEISDNLESGMQIHYLDVGQGDSTFLELPNHETMLIDAGESENASKIINYIKNLGYDKLDYIIATHPHTDHIGGLAKILETFTIGSIYMPKAVSTTRTYENLLNTILKKDLKVKIAKDGVSIINHEKFTVKVVAPNNTDYNKLNNYSAVLKITYKDQAFLFMGDAEKESENEINADIKANVIKIGHHGSDTSSNEEFIQKVSPEYAIISVGKNNKYNHPSDLVIKRLKNMGTKVYRTDENGTILLKTNGETLLFETTNTIN